VPGDDRIYEIAKFWIASAMMNTQTDAKQKDRVPYLFWSSQGQKFGDTTWHYVDIVEGDRVGIQCAIDFMSDLVNEGMYPYCIGYDSWHIGDLEQDKLKRFVGESRTLPVPPTMKAISPLVREHELDLKAHRVICPNPCLHHNRESVQVRVDPQENVQVQKKDLQPHQKIDGFMAELYSLAAFNKFKDGYLSSIGWVPPEGDALVES
jgi:phage terminase large subunit-like protein